MATDAFGINSCPYYYYLVLVPKTQCLMYWAGNMEVVDLIPAWLQTIFFKSFLSLLVQIRLSKQCRPKSDYSLVSLIN